jgi:hypothetical protein
MSGEESVIESLLDDHVDILDHLRGRCDRN